MFRLVLFEHLLFSLWHFGCFLVFWLLGKILPFSLLDPDKIIVLGKLRFLVEWVDTAHNCPFRLFLFDYFEAINRLGLFFVSAWLTIFQSLSTRLLVVSKALWPAFIKHGHEVLQFFPHESDDFVLTRYLIPQLRDLIFVCFPLFGQHILCICSEGGDSFRGF